MNRKVRIGADIGGTFTDVVLEVEGQQYAVKVLTQQDVPEAGVLAGIREVLNLSGHTPNDVSLVIHGTTLATNALIERKGARTALITTQGFRDTLEMGTESRFEQYDLFLKKPEPLVPRHLRFPVPERLDARGEVLLPLDEQAVEALIPDLQREELESLAIGLLHSFVNPRHERRIRDLLHDHLPDLRVSLSSEVSPEMREYERFSTTAANAYIQPLMASYLQRLEQRLQSSGITCPLLMMLSGGGLATLDTAMRFPIRLVESGPAGGAIFAADLARRCGLDRVVSFDMGGTTAKLCLIDDGQPQSGRHFEVARIYRFKKGSGLPLRIPVIDMVEIGAGGGSIANVDDLKRIAVGPESAGSAPGPACYGNGGAHPTVTDADLHLGRIDAQQFSGGRITLDVEAANVALAEHVGNALELSDTLAAFGISEVVDENMANAARVHAIENGKRLDDRTLIAFGGAAPLHATRLADKLGIERVLVPVSAGVGSAVGFLRAPAAYEIARSFYQRWNALDLEAVNQMFAEMQSVAREVVQQCAPDGQLHEERLAYMRYLGQGHEIAVPVPEKSLASEDLTVLHNEFENAYKVQYGRTIPNVELEILSWSLRIYETKPAEVESLETTGTPPESPAPEGVRQWFDPEAEQFVTAPVFQRDSLILGQRISGPAVIVETDTATIVSAAFVAEVDQKSNLVLFRKQTDS
ncbi:MAG: hydantoinase/oxoprolinase family protein [SAR324 cluster bacterium]|nr:hydantoinase/oxoprolinase family protein [SAR324 cluster bacterium]